jgi:hypothetical protein
MRKEVRRSSALLVDVPELHDVHRSSLELHRRTEPRPRVVRRRCRFPGDRAALDRFVVPRVAHWC